MRRNLQMATDGEEPECGGGEAYIEVKEGGEDDEDEHGDGVHEELGVGLVEGGDGAGGHVCEDKEGEAIGDVSAVLHGLSVLDCGGRGVPIVVYEH